MAKTFGRRLSLYSWYAGQIAFFAHFPRFQGETLPHFSRFQGEANP
jgi:hypothetical protein